MRFFTLALAFLFALAATPCSPPLPAQAGPLSGLKAQMSGREIGAGDGVAPATRLVASDRNAARAEAAKRRGIATLVIAFEGLFSHSQSYADGLLDYQDRLREGKAGSPPNPLAMNFIGRHLLTPVLSETKSRAEFVTFSENSQNGENAPAEKCAVAWHGVYGEGLNLIVVGHSFGGYAALNLCKRLAARGIPVDHLLTIDARTMPGNYKHFVAPANVADARNFFQKSLVMPGYEIKGAKNVKIKGIGHGDMPGAKQVREAFAAMLAGGSSAGSPPVATGDPGATVETAPPAGDDAVAPPAGVSGDPGNGDAGNGSTGIGSLFSGIFSGIGKFLGQAADFIKNLFGGLFKR